VRREEKLLVCCKAKLLRELSRLLSLEAAAGIREDATKAAEIAD
jgi:hypothetical protein